MLLYIKSNMYTSLISSMTSILIPDHITSLLREEHLKQMLYQKELAEAHLYMHISVVLIEDIFQFIEKQTSDLIDFENVRKLKVLKSCTSSEFKVNYNSRYFNKLLKN